MSKIVCEIDNNYVVNRKVVGNAYQPRENEVVDTSQTSGIGDWYEASEGIFYRPVNAVPPDSPFSEGPSEQPE